MEQDKLLRFSAKDLDLVALRHKEIVEGACKVFFKKGYQRATIREIARACGMSMGQLYHYIESKDDVLYLIYRHMQLLWYEYLTKSGIEEIQDPLERLRKAVRNTLEFSLKNKPLFLFVYTETKYLKKKYLHVVLDMDDKNVVGFWRRLLRGLQKESNDERDIDFLGNLLSYLMMFLPLRSWDLKQKEMDAYFDPLLAFILKGLDITP
jgi:AcrR family transcriptional regulator